MKTIKLYFKVLFGLMISFWAALPKLKGTDIVMSIITALIIDTIGIVFMIPGIGIFAMAYRVIHNLDEDTDNQFNLIEEKILEL